MKSRSGMAVWSGGRADSGTGDLSSAFRAMEGRDERYRWSSWPGWSTARCRTGRGGPGLLKQESGCDILDPGGGLVGCRRDVGRGFGQ